MNLIESLCNVTAKLYVLLLVNANGDNVGLIEENNRYFEAVQLDWIWVDAYKGTDRNMVCKGKQYRMNIEDTYGDKVVLGSKGYHVALNLKDCFKTYDYDFQNRFFKVKALVKASEYEYHNPNNTTLVAKAIKFVEEITDAPETIAAKRNSVAR